MNNTINEEDPAYGACSGWVMDTFDAIAFDDRYDECDALNVHARKGYLALVAQGREVYN